MEKIFSMLENLRPEFNFRNSTNFIDDGYLDSFDMVQLVADIEETFNVKIDGLDIVPGNFETAEAIVNLVRKSGGTI